MRKWVILLVAGIGALYPLHAVEDKPPEGVDWYETLNAAKAAALSKKLPVLIFCHDTTYEASNKMHEFFRRALLRTLCRHFVCLYLNQVYKREAYQQAYVPYLASVPTHNIRPPIVVICDKTLWPQKEFRIEGYCPEFERFASNLEGALRKLAPEEFTKFITERIPDAPWDELTRRLEEHHMRTTGAVKEQKKRKEALQQARTFLKALEKRIKSNLTSKRAKPLLKALKKYASQMKRLATKKRKRAEEALKKVEESFAAFFDLFKAQAARMKDYWGCGKPGHPLFRKDPKRCPLCKKPTKRLQFDPADLWGCGEENHPKYFGAHPARCSECGKELQQGR